MKSKFLAFSLLLTGLLFSSVHPVRAQGTAITYQGRLNDGTNPANGSYDLKFTLFGTNSGGSSVAGPVTNAPTAASNGLFTVTLDFGAGIFTGPARWLEIGVRTNGSGGAYSTLSPRQPLTPAPYAITASNLTGSLPAAQLSGLLSSNQFSGTYGNAVTLNNAGNSFTGNGGGLTSLNASQLTSGTVPDARLSANVALLNATQTFTQTNVFASGGGAGRLIVSNTFVAVDTNLFTGLALQYDSIFGEGAIMSASSSNVGTAYLSFYTKASGQPITKQMIIDSYGNVAIDQGNRNNGSLNNSSPAGAGLTFGVSSGAGIASKRTAGGNQYGLDFYTDFSNRMSIFNDGFVGINGSTRMTPSEYFGILAPVTNTWGGMDIQTLAAGRPFYGYANASGSSWTEMDGTDGNKWKLNNSGYWLTVTTSGAVGIGTTSPGSLLHVAGDTRIEGVTQIGTGTGNAETPDRGLIIRRVKSTDANAGSVVARTDKLTLERDGTYAGWRVVNAASPGNTTIAATGLTSGGATVTYVHSIDGGDPAGTNGVFNNAQNIVSFRCSFGNSYDPGHMTEVSLTRWPTDYFWTGTLNSTFNQ